MTSKKTKNKKGRYNFLIDESVYKEFSAICEEKGLVRSKQIENYMKKMIKEKKDKEKKS
jgi:antitoxin component of RelBE/YafQ-DinJ toxin-antitoxin module